MIIEHIVGDIYHHIWATKDLRLKYFELFNDKDYINRHMAITSFLRHIRNYYKLWDRPWTPKIIDGVDYSDEHPDNISGEIFKILCGKLDEEFKNQAVANEMINTEFIPQNFQLLKKYSHAKYNKYDKDIANFGQGDDPLNILRVDETYEIYNFEVHTWHTLVYLKDVRHENGRLCKFNSSLFELIERES